MNPAQKSVLVTSANQGLSLTGNCEVDTRTALTRGLAEYVEQMSINMPAGRQLVFKQVLATWSEPEMPARYPSAVVYTPTTGTYDASRFVPGINPSRRLPMPDGRYFLALADFMVDLVVELWATDPKERLGLVKMLEDEMNPTDFMYGFRLDLPYYFNARAEYEMKSLEYMESEDEAMRRYRRAQIVVGGRIPLMKLVSFPSAKMSTRVTVIESDEQLGTTEIL